MTVKLYGALGMDIVNSNPTKGIEVDLPNGSTISNLLARINIEDPEGVMVIKDQQIADPGALLVPGTIVKIFRMIAGGDLRLLSDNIDSGLSVILRKCA